MKVKHKHSSAVAYIYNNNQGQPCAVTFRGRKNRPDFKFAFLSGEARSFKVKNHFEAVQAQEDHAKALQAARRQPHTLEIGHILVSSWGYEQTNIDFYQVTRIVGRYTVEVRPIGKMSHETAWAQGRCTPVLDLFTGEAVQRRVNNGRVKISSHQSAGIWDGTPMHWTAYA